MIYLDNAATTLQKPPEVLDAMGMALKQMGSAGRSSHRAAALASETLFECRKEAAELFDIGHENVIFTFNATHALNIAIKSVVSPGDRVVISGFEHNAVLRPLHEIGANIIVAERSVFDKENTLKAFSDLIDENTKAVVCTHVSNVYGYVLPIEEIGEICVERDVPFIVDAAQSAGILPVSMKEMNASFIAMPGHKGLFGPQGTGLLLCGNIMPKTIMEGGTGSASRFIEMPQYLPDRLEVGTQNCHGIAGLLAGIRYIKRISVEAIATHELRLVELMRKNISNDKLNVFGSDHCQSGVLSIVPKDCSCEELGDSLSNSGFAVRVGLHCAPLAHESGGSLHTGTVRISVSAMTSDNDVFRLCEFLNMKKL